MLSENCSLLGRDTVRRQASELTMCGSRKYPYPHHGGNWNSEGVGDQRPRKFWRVGGLDGQFGFQVVDLVTKILSYLLSRSFT